MTSSIVLSLQFTKYQSIINKGSYEAITFRKTYKIILNKGGMFQ